MRTIAIAAAFLLVQLATSGREAQASEATPPGVSVGVGFDSFLDGTLTDASGQSVSGHSGDLRFGVLANVGDLAFGGGVGWIPDILGDGRLLVGARAGWQPTFGTTRIHLLGELGIHRYTHIDEWLFGLTTPDFLSTPYLGAELGMTHNARGGLFEFGVALFIRHDVDQETVVHSDGGNFLGGPTPPPTELTVGGTMIGASLTLGFRLDSENIKTLQHHQGFGR